MPAGKLIAEPLVNATVALALVASIIPVFLVGLLPEIVNVFAPTVNPPEVAASVPVTVNEAPKLTPPAQFKVKLFKVLLKMPPGKLIGELLVNATVALALVASI